MWSSQAGKQMDLRKCLTSWLAAKLISQRVKCQKFSGHSGKHVTSSCVLKKAIKRRRFPHMSSSLFAKLLALDHIFDPRIRTMSCRRISNWSLSLYIGHNTRDSRDCNIFLVPCWFSYLYQRFLFIISLAEKPTKSTKAVFHVWLPVAHSPWRNVLWTLFCLTVTTY